jgi:hypothetical protein
MNEDDLLLIIGRLYVENLILQSLVKNLQDNQTNGSGRMPVGVDDDEVVETR